MSWWDIVVVLVIALAIWQGYMRGFFRNLCGWIGIIVSFIVVWFNLGAFDRIVSSQYNGRSAVAGWLHHYMMQKQQNNAFIDQEKIKKIVEMLPLPDNMNVKILSDIDQMQQSLAAELYNHVAQSIAIPVWQIMVLLGSWLVVFVAICIISYCIHYLLTYSTFLESLDRFVGAFFAAVASLLLLGVISGIAGLVTPDVIKGAVANSFFAPFLQSILVLILKAPGIFF